MYYEINVSKDGRHFFATADRSITNVNDLHIVYRAIKKGFPESEGYSIDITKEIQYGEIITEVALKNDTTLQL